MEKEILKHLISEVLSTPPPDPDNKEAIEIWSAVWRANQKLNQTHDRTNRETT